MKSHPAGTFATIDDEYTEDGFLFARQGLFPDVRFIFRRALGKATMKFMKQIEKIDNNIARDEYGARFLIKYLFWWDVVHQKGHVLPIDEHSIMEVIKPELYTELLNIILGSSSSAIDPKWSDEKVEQLIDEDAKSELEVHRRIEEQGEDPRQVTEFEKVQVQQESDLKNS